MTSEDFNNSKYYELLINNGSDYSAYWMSSRCVNAYSYNASSNGADFGVSYVSSGRVRGSSLCYFDGIEYPGNCAFRPCITLNSNVQVTSGSGSPESPFNIQ